MKNLLTILVFLLSLSCTAMAEPKHDSCNTTIRQVGKLAKHQRLTLKTKGSFKEGYMAVYGGKAKTLFFIIGLDMFKDRNPPDGYDYRGKCSTHKRTLDFFLYYQKAA